MDKKCNGCDRSAHTLTANCGHRTCFYCIKNNKSANKCSRCSASPFNNRSSSVSPAKPNKSIQKSSHLRSQETKLYPDYMANLSTQRHLSSNNREQPPRIMTKQNLQCPQHQEPFTMFCKSTSDIICSICLCRKPNYGQDILPLKNAEDVLRKENKSQREEARVFLSDIEYAWRTVNKNRQALEQQIQTHTNVIKNFFFQLNNELEKIENNTLRLCTDFLKNKIEEYGEISDDLNYLAETIKQFRGNSRDNCSLNELTYLHSSYKVIKTTIKDINFDYIGYDKQNIQLLQFNQDLMEKIKNELVGFRFSLPIKQSQKNKKQNRSHSNKSRHLRQSPDTIMKNKHKITEAAKQKKHKLSLCSNGSVDYGNQENNLYKKLLKAKYKF